MFREHILYSTDTKKVVQLIDISLMILNEAKVVVIDLKKIKIV